MSHQILLGSILRLGVKGHHGLRIVILVLIVAIVVAFVLVRQRRQSRPAPRTARHGLASLTRSHPEPAGDRPDAVVPNVKVSSSNDLQAQGVGTVAMPVRRSRAEETLSTIEARGLTKRYGDKLAVDDLSFEVKPGHVTGVPGPNGAGKSTTMRLIMGLDAPN